MLWVLLKPEEKGMFEGFFTGTLWERASYLLLIAGFAIFINFVMDFSKHAQAALKGLKLRIKNDWNRQIAESKKLTEKWKNGRSRVRAEKKTR